MTFRSGILALAVALVGCGGGGPQGGDHAAPAPTYVETGDLPALGARGMLRILVHTTPHEDLLPRDGGRRRDGP